MYRLAHSSDHYEAMEPGCYPTNKQTWSHSIDDYSPEPTVAHMTTVTLQP
jgi:hypothetical protein